MFRNIDTTYGFPNLEHFAQDNYDKSEIDLKFLEFNLAEEFRVNYKKSWLLQLLSSYPNKNFKLGDILWYRHIKQMVLEGTLFMQCFYINNWAFRDCQIEDNINNIKHLGFNIDLEKKRNSDGLFSYDSDLKLLKVYPTDKETPKLISDSIIIKNGCGIVEFGSQKICKTAMTLLNNQILLRIPYKINMFTKPMGAIFYNTAPYYEKLK
mgnify:CR=1 FL=1|tara:strand:- start:275 stop:901 length:627 start_codon:yes stop_codon:yes gene_type:complete